MTMRVAYLYNEILPTRRAHDGYVWRNCASLAQAGLTMTLACGRGSGAASALAAHYDTALPAGLRVEELAILRRNWGLPFTWNRVFDAAAQRFLARERPEVAVLSVRKQGGYHLARKLPGMRYVYEVHELAWYPTMGDPRSAAAAIEEERRMLAQADLVTVTTPALREILMAPPYALANAVEIVPLAIAPVPEPAAIAHSTPLHVMYVGQLYEEQGVEDLVHAALQSDEVALTIVGGTDDEVARLQATVPEPARGRIRFAGFVSPARIASLAATAHAFAAPFRAERRMPFIAHTKLLEYVALRRPVVAPDMPIVRAHFPGGAGLAAYASNDRESLAAALQALARRGYWESLMQGVARIPLLDWSARAEAYARLLRRR
jgi:glycosyltransferase involved in cell wall biosynthesis